MRPYKMKNRYGEEYIFTPQQDGTILWEGDFRYCTIGYPNDYTQAFFEYVKDTGGGISVNQFSELVHAYDETKEAYVLEDRKYANLITSNTALISTVDPPGGPFLCSGMAVESISEELEGLEIHRFERVDTGYKIYLIKN